MTVSKIIAITVLVGGITAAITLAATIGMDFPKFASQNHVAKSVAKTDARIDILVGSVKSTRELSLENAIAREELRAGNLEIQAAQLEAVGMNSQPLIDQAKLLRKSVAKRERQLLKLEN